MKNITLLSLLLFAVLYIPAQADEPTTHLIKIKPLQIHLNNNSHHSDNYRRKLAAALIMRHSQYADASVLFHLALEQAPADKTVLYAIVNFCMMTEQVGLSYCATAELIERFIKADRHNALPWLFKTQFALQSGDRYAAVQTLEAAAQAQFLHHYHIEIKQLYLEAINTFYPAHPNANQAATGITAALPWHKSHFLPACSKSRMPESDRQWQQACWQAGKLMTDHSKSELHIALGQQIKSNAAQLLGFEIGFGLGIEQIK